MRRSIVIMPSRLFCHTNLFGCYFGVTPRALDYECDLCHEVLWFENYLALPKVIFYTDLSKPSCFLC